jgi:hypothetical protein
MAPAAGQAEAVDDPLEERGVVLDGGPDQDLVEEAVARVINVGQERHHRHRLVVRFHRVLEALGSTGRDGDSLVLDVAGDPLGPRNQCALRRRDAVQVRRLVAGAEVALEEAEVGNETGQNAPRLGRDQLEPVVGAVLEALAEVFAQVGVLAVDCREVVVE